MGGRDWIYGVLCNTQQWTRSVVISRLVCKKTGFHLGFFHIIFGLSTTLCHVVKLSLRSSTCLEGLSDLLTST